jgi:hypothetical protein
MRKWRFSIFFYKVKREKRQDGRKSFSSIRSAPEPVVNCVTQALLRGQLGRNPQNVKRIKFMEDFKKTGGCL